MADSPIESPALRVRSSAGSGSDLSGRTAVVTGGASGLGAAVGRSLAARGAQVILGVRNMGKAQNAIAGWTSDLPRHHQPILPLELNLLDLDSVRRFAEAVAANTMTVDVLVLNAGISSQLRSLSAEGVESQLATNHFGHFVLTGRLLGTISAAPAGRIVTVSSNLYPTGKLGLTDSASSGTYSAGRAYARSKLANVLFGRELERRLRRTGSSVHSFIAHPGMARTPLHDTSPSRGLRILTKSVAPLIARETDAAAVATLYAATAPRADPALFLGPAGSRAHPHVRGVPFKRAGPDLTQAAELWA